MNIVVASLRKRTERRQSFVTATHDRYHTVNSKFFVGKILFEELILISVELV
jgi:hypothetical protein